MIGKSSGPTSSTIASAIGKPLPDKVTGGNDPRATGRGLGKPSFTLSPCHRDTVSGSPVRPVQRGDQLVPGRDVPVGEGVRLVFFLRGGGPLGAFFLGLGLRLDLFVGLLDAVLPVPPRAP